MTEPRTFCSRSFLFFAPVLLCGSLLVLPARLHAALDTDGDGISDSDETNIYATDPLLTDTDGDGSPDTDDITRGFSPRFGDKKKLIEVDSDKDYLNDAWEVLLGTGGMNPDTDGDR